MRAPDTRVTLVQPGQRYGKLVVVALHSVDKYWNKRWLCLCDCGRESTPYGASLRRRNGSTKSCGCESPVPELRHGACKTPEWRAWSCMRDRCLSPVHKQYRNYGGRGITICERWSDFNNFLSDMGPRPSRMYSLDRIDNNKGYSPDNCRWATREQQQNNLRVNVRGLVHGEELTLAEACRKYQVSYGMAFHRLKKGMSFEDALLTPRRVKRKRVGSPYTNGRLRRESKEPRA